MGHGGYPVLSEDPTLVNEATPTRKLGTMYRYYHSTYGWWTLMYVFVDDAVNVTVGMSLCFSDLGQGNVTPDRAGGSALLGAFAGVAIGSITAGRYGFIVCGFGDEVEVLTDGAVAGAGETLVVHATADGQADGNAHSTVEQRVFGYSLEADDSNAFCKAILTVGA